ncbi:Putative cell wall binding repeat-containing protein [Lachnospiraceae bacterium NE2001]|nr:Putative cell wall binding repeat-containing protein [Lachnospiraceae bacterium NE2001]
MRSKKFVKKLAITVLSAALCMGSAVASFAASGTWKQDSNGWWYSYSDGSYAKKKWVQIDKVWYYFKEDGYMSSSEYREGYWIDGSGACSSKYVGGAWKSNKTGKWYEDKTGYYPVSCWLQIDGSYYYFESSGYLATDKWIGDYYVDKDGKWVKDAKFVDYSGTYVDNFAGRGTITVTHTYDNYYSVKVKWPTSASVTNEWAFLGQIDMSGTFNYTNCTKTETIFDGKGGSSSKTVYSDGTGTMKFTETQVTWEDKKENVARGNTFIKTKEIEVEGKDYSGEYEDPISHRAAVKVEATYNGFYNVTIGLPDDSGDLDAYTFTGSFDKDGKLTYTDAVKTHETYGTNGKTTTKQLYKKGSGSITITGKKLKWVNDNEEVSITDFELYK